MKHHMTTTQIQAPAQINYRINSTPTWLETNEALRIIGSRGGNAGNYTSRLVDIFDADNSVTGYDPTTLYLENSFRGVTSAQHVINAFLSNSQAVTPTGPGWYVGIQSNLTARFGSGGTATNPKGTWQAISGLVSVSPGANFVNGIGGCELDVAISKGGSAFGKMGLNIVSGSGDPGADAVKALDPDYDTGIQITAATVQDVGFHNGIVVGSKGFGWPIHADGSIFTIGDTANARTCAHGIDFGLVDFSGFFLRSKSFSVDGRGMITTNNKPALSRDVAIGTAVLSFTNGLLTGLR